MSLDVERLADAMLAGAQALIAKATAPLMARIADLTAENAKLYDVYATIDGRVVRLAADLKEMPTSSQLEALRAGIDKTIEAIDAREQPDVADMVQEAVSAAVGALEPPEVPDVAPLVAEAVRAAVDALPKPQDTFGPEIEAALSPFKLAMEQGSDLRERLEELRRAIPEPPDLSDFATKREMEVLRNVTDNNELVASLVIRNAEKDEAIAAMATRLDAIVIPEPPDMNGLATKDDVAEAVAAIPAVHVPNAAEIRGIFDGLVASIPVPVIPDPIPGAPGVGIAEVKQNDDGELIVKLTTGETFNTGKVRGADGFGFEDMSVDWDGERTLTLTFTKDGRTETTAIVVPCIIDRGVWRDGSFERGDGVTWGGSFFIAQRDTTDKPETSDAWRLSVKRGRDGKDYRSPEARGPVKAGAPSK